MAVDSFHRTTKKRAKSSSFKFCAVCKSKHGPVFPFPGTLQYHGIKGTEATIACIRQLARKSVKEVRNDGRPQAPNTAVERTTADRITEIYQQLAANRPAFRKLVVGGRDL